MSIKKLFVGLLFLLPFSLVFRAWFLPGLITGGDFWPIYKTMYETWSIIPYAWDPNGGYGLGASAIPLLWIHANFGIVVTIFGKLLGMDWELVERFAYLYPFLLISGIFSVLCFKKFFPKSRFYIFAPLVFIFNTYILMILGGQVQSLGMGYSLIPVIFYFYLKENLHDFKKIIVVGLIFSSQLIFDLRVFYITFLAFSLFVLFERRSVLKTVKFLVPLVVLIFLLNAFWLIPLILFPSNPLSDLGSAYNSTEAVKFFSFARIENSLALLHPNWPENIFGKVGFMKPEFLVLPILAFLPLLFFKSFKDSEKTRLLFLVVVLLTAVFLAKGANEPFGQIYIWLFGHFPGFVMFRDPTKFYAIIAFAYSMLIPFSIGLLYELVSKRSNKLLKWLPQMVITGVSIYLLFLIYPALEGKLNDSFETRFVPQEYMQLEEKLANETQFSRVLWIPTLQRFGFYSDNHPALTAKDFFKISFEDSLHVLQKPGVEQKLQDLGVKYIVVPYDPIGEIYQTDRKYDEKKYTEFIQAIGSTPWLTRVDGFNKIGVFEMNSHRNLFWTDMHSQVSYTRLNPSSYSVEVKNAIKGERLIFLQSANPLWEAKFDGQKLPWLNYQGFNDFVLPRNGDFVVSVDFKPQTAVNIGSIIGVISFIGCIFLLVRRRNT